MDGCIHYNPYLGKQKKKKKKLCKHNKKATPLKEMIMKEVNNFVEKALLKKKTWIHTENKASGLNHSRHLGEKPIQGAHPNRTTSSLKVLTTTFIHDYCSAKIFWFYLTVQLTLRYTLIDYYDMDEWQSTHTHISKVRKQFLPFFMSRKGGLLKQYGHRG